MGYPSKPTPEQWVEEYESTGALHDGYRARTPKYSEAKKQAAIDYYREHGRSLVRCVRALGYPNRYTLAQWLDEAGVRKTRVVTGGAPRGKAKFTFEQKQAAVMDLRSRDGPAQKVPIKHGVTRAVLCKWRSDLLGKGSTVSSKNTANKGPVKTMVCCLPEWSRFRSRSAPSKNKSTGYGLNRMFWRPRQKS